MTELVNVYAEAGTGIGASYGVQLGAPVEVIVRNSRLIGQLAGLFSNGNGTANLVSTQVSGVLNTLGTVRCIGSYDESFDELDPSCL